MIKDIFRQPLPPLPGLKHQVFTDEQINEGLVMLAKRREAVQLLGEAANAKARKLGLDFKRLEYNLTDGAGI